MFVEMYICNSSVYAIKCWLSNADIDSNNVSINLIYASEYVTINCVKFTVSLTKLYIYI